MNSKHLDVAMQTRFWRLLLKVLKRGGSQMGDISWPCCSEACCIHNRVDAVLLPESGLLNDTWQKSVCTLLELAALVLHVAFREPL